MHDYWILGPVESCIDRLLEYADAGARHILFSISCPDDDYLRHLETISKEIIRSIRERFTERSAA